MANSRTGAAARVFSLPLPLSLSFSLSLSLSLALPLMALPLGGCGRESAQPAPPQAVALEEVRFQVDGMHCGSCAEAITEELAQDPARSGIDVSHETRVAVFFVPEGTSAARASAAEAIRKLGYTVTDLEPGAAAGPVPAQAP